MKIEFVDRFNFLGIVIIKHLKRTISKKMSRTLGIMTKITQQLPSNALIYIYNALILPHLNYGLLIWGWKSEKLISLQKRAMSIISKSHCRAHTTELFRNIIYLFKIKIYMRKFEHSWKPHHFTYEMEKKI